MKTRLTLLLTLVIIIACKNNMWAQTRSDERLQMPPANINIDGNLNDWTDSLRYHNTEKNIDYSLANDNENLYAVIRISDRLEQARVLNAGVTLSIDTKGKKKETFSMTFPLRYPGTPVIPFNRGDSESISKEDRDELMRERITSLRSIKMTGFKDIENEMITTSNTYGIKAAIDYDTQGDLICEAAIPLNFFHADNIAKNEWAFNFKINGMQKPDHNADGGENSGNREGMQGGGRGGMGGGRMGGMGGGGRMGGGRGGRGMGRSGNMQGSTDRSELFKSVDFWAKYYLNK